MADTTRPAPGGTVAGPLTGAGGLCTLVLMAAYAGPAAAEAWLIQPTVAFTTRYEDNIRLVPDEEEDAWTNAPTVQALVSRQTETMDVRALGRLTYRIYEGSADLDDRGDQLARLGSKFRTERSVFGLDGSWRRQDALARRSGGNEDLLGDEALPGEVDDDDADTGQVREQVIRNRADLVPSYTYQLSERTEVGANVAYRNQYYEDDDADLGLTDYEQYTLSLNHRYRLDERTIWTNSLRGIDYEAPDVDREYQTNEILTGINRAFTERLRVGFLVGWRETDFDTPTDDGSNSGYTLQLTGTLRDELSTLFGRLSHRLVPSATGDVVEQDELLVRYRYQMTPRLRAGIVARYFENESLELENESANRRYLNVEPELDYALSLAWSLRATVFHEREDRDSFDREATNTGIMFSLVYTPPSELD